MPLFQFSLNTMQITDTRSTHKDTDWVSFTLKVGTATLVSTSRPMGDLNNGTFDIGLSFSRITINPGDTVVLNYLIINSGGPSSADTIQDTLKLLGNRLASSFNLPSLTSSLELVASQFYQELGPIINEKSCDGLVAAEQNAFSYEQLLSDTSDFPYFTQSTSHTGVTTRGCNSRPSAYVVNWSMAQVVAVPSVTNMPLGEPVPLGFSGTPQTAREVLSQVFLQAQVAKGDPSSTGSEVRGQSQNPPGQLVPKNSFVTLQTILAQ